MNIGLDLDGVILDYDALKRNAAKALYNVTIPPEKTRKAAIISAGFLTEEQHSSLLRIMCDTFEYLELMVPTEGAMKHLNQLEQEHNLRVITSRYEQSRNVVEEWMKRISLSLPVTYVGVNKSKQEACQGLDVYVDDDLDKLEPLINNVPNLFLFSWDYNSGINVGGTGIKKVQSWNQLYGEIQKL